MNGLITLAEVVSILGRHGGLKAVPTVDHVDGDVTLYVTIQPTDGSTMGECLEAAALADELRYLCDVAQMRGFATRYGIDPAALEALLLPQTTAGETFVGGERGGGKTARLETQPCVQLSLAVGEAEALATLIAGCCNIRFGTLPVEQRPVLLAVRDRLIAAQERIDGPAAD